MNKWPKVLPPLDAEQQRINDDFMHYWHEVFAGNLGFADRWNHRYVVDHAPRKFTRTLEIGSGLGEHLAWEKLSPAQELEYVAVELRPNMAQQMRERFPAINIIVADVQAGLPFPEDHFDRIIAVHVLEHLPNLPAAIREMHRLAAKEATVNVVIPWEGSLATSIARRLSAQRLYEKRYGVPYDRFIRREHINLPAEVIEELLPFFEIRHRSSFPIPLPIGWCNLFLGMTMHPRK